MNIFIAGHNGMVGRSISDILSTDSSINIITANRSELDLVCQNSVRSFLKKNKIDQIYLAAAKVGGILANNNYPANFIYENLMIQSNIIDSAHREDINKILFLGSSCIYPKHASQPIKEDYLLKGPLESTNEPYAIAKIAGIKMCESYNRQYGRDYRSIMPTNLYGPYDNFHSENSHVIPALISRFHNALENNEKNVTIWGSGNPKREFLYVSDMARAAIHVMNCDISSLDIEPMSSHINIGCGHDISIKDLAKLISEVVNFRGIIKFDISKPDGTPRKLLDISKLKSSGWQPSMSLEEGIQITYQWYKKNIDSTRNF